MPTIDGFLEIFDEFAAENQTKLDYYLELAKGQASEKAFGDFYSHAVYLLTAHNFTMSKPAAAASGQKASEKVGDISISYKTGGEDDLDSFLRQTNYGLQFLELRASRVIGMGVVE